MKVDGGICCMMMQYDLTTWTAPLWNWNNSTNVGVTSLGGGLGTNVNNNFNDAEADLYKYAQVKKSLYRFTIRFTGSNDAGSDFIFAYKFTWDLPTTNTTGEIKFSTSAEAQQSWLNIRNSKGWVWRRFSGINSGGSIFPSSGIIDIKVPSVGKLVYGLSPGQEVSVGTPIATLDHLVQNINSNQPPDRANMRGFITIVVFKANGAANGAGDVTMDVACYQKATIMRSTLAGDTLQEITDIS